MADHENIDPAPTPVPAKKAGAQWLGRTIVREQDAQDLEREAAINEFGHKMPRQQAEDEAHGAYTKRQRVEAAAHHLVGMKAAHAAGDMESARKHAMMYELHSKALGHEPVGPAHPEVTALMEKAPAKVYRFKPHHGDVYAVEDRGARNFDEQPLNSAHEDPSGKANAEAKHQPLGKAVDFEPERGQYVDPGDEHLVGQVNPNEPGQARGESGEGYLKRIGVTPAAPPSAPLGAPCTACQGVGANHNPNSGRAVFCAACKGTGVGVPQAKPGAFLQDMPAAPPNDPRGRFAGLDVSDPAGLAAPAAPADPSGRFSLLEVDKAELGKREALYAIWCAAESLLKGEVVGEIHGATPPKYKGRTRDLHNDVGHARARKWAKDNGWGHLLKEPQKKAEPAPKPKVVPCRCDAYHHPHRAGGGKCGAK